MGNCLLISPRFAGLMFRLRRCDVMLVDLDASGVLVGMQIMWRTTGARALLLLLRVVASPSPGPQGGHLRGLAAAACRRWEEEQEVSAGPLRFDGSSDSVASVRKNSKDLRAAETKFAERICWVVKRGEWGAGTVNELERMKIRLRARLVSKVLRGLGDADVAHCFFQWAGQQPSFCHSLQAYHAIFEIMGAARKFVAQQQLLQDMHCQGLQANTSTFNILLLGFSRANDTDKVVETFKQMVQYGEENAFAFKCVIRSLVRSARVLEALPIYKKMMEFGYVPDNFTYNGLIEGLCEAGAVEEAFSIFQEMEDRGLSPDAITHAALVKVLDTKGTH